MSDTQYFRPLVQIGPVRPRDALTLAGGWGWFNQVEVLARGQGAQVISASEAPVSWRATLAAEREPVAGLAMNRPQVMGIVNTTPDSFSDGGQHAAVTDAVAAGLAMVEAGADILDIGGESTRPGAQAVDAAEETQRIEPVIKGLRAAGYTGTISIDTRKAGVAKAALSAGADLVNDVSGFTYDPDLAPFCARANAPVCVMHALGDPASMQDNPHYEDVLLDVYDYLLQRIEDLQCSGIPRGQIIADPGIGFGKTQAHNLALLSRLSLFHGLGVPILLGASRKGFIGRIGKAPNPQDRAPGSIAVGLSALAQGVQILRVHDVGQTVQAVALWRASCFEKDVLL